MNVSSLCRIVDASLLGLAVQAAVARMTPWPQPAALDPKTLEAMVAAAFSQRRKLLRHSLGHWLEARGFAGEFNLQRRAEEVPVAEYIGLAQQLSSAR
jgi:16S rRNA (adenine1518-N6/adenine1519-N6)-dimethyltransferase